MSVPTPILQYNLSDATMKGLLPAGYTPLAYIEFPGSGGGIDLGYKFNALTDKYEIEFLAVSNTTQNGMILASNGSKYSWLYYYNTSGIKTYITDSNGSLRNSGNGPNDLHKHIVRYHDRKWYIDRGDSSATGTYESYSFVQDTNNLCLGDYSTSQSYPFKGKIYRVKIWNNNILQRDLIPAAHSSGNGYYDLVTRVFYTRSGLIAGPELAIGKNGGKSLPEEYLLVEYLQMAPGLYINTGQAVAASDVTKTEAWMWYASGNTRDLMGWSTSAAEYWGCTAGSVWEKVTGVSPITQRQKVVYNYTATVAGTYQIGALTGGYSTRTKYIEQVKITIGGSLKRNLYACYRKSDMKPGMYDTVNGVFYTNAGSGEFILGPSITNCYTYEPNGSSFGVNLWAGQQITIPSGFSALTISGNNISNIYPDWDETKKFQIEYVFPGNGSYNVSGKYKQTYTEGRNLRWYLNDTAIGTTTSANSEVSFSHTFNITDWTTLKLKFKQIGGYAGYIHDLKIEKGTTATSLNTNYQGLYTNLSGIYDSSKGWVAGFNGSNSSVYSSVDLVSMFNTRIWTISFWFNTADLPPGESSSNWKRLFIYRKATTSNASTKLLVIYLTKTKVGSSFYGDDYALTISELAINTWYHLVVTLNGTTATFYINGLSIGTATKGTLALPDGSYLLLGYDADRNAGAFNGKLSNVQIWDSVLTAAQVKELYGK